MSQLSAKQNDTDFQRGEANRRRLQQHTGDLLSHFNSTMRLLEPLRETGEMLVEKGEMLRETGEKLRGAGEMLREMGEMLLKLYIYLTNLIESNHKKDRKEGRLNV